MGLSENYYKILKTEGNNIAKALKSKGISGTFTGSDFDRKIYQLPTLDIIYHTEVQYDEEKAAEIAETAQSYLDAIEDGRLVIVYNAGYSTLSGANQVLRNSNGVHCIQCSAFVGLVLRGIAYENSPFVDDDGSKVTARSDLFTWANSDYERGGITEANQLAQYALQTGCILNSNDISNAKKGDILFYSNDAENFAGIWHVALVLEDGGTTCVHALNGRSSAIWTYDMTNPPSNLIGLKYIARPRYNVDFTALLDTLLKITKQPENYRGILGSTATFTVEAQGEGLTYQWQYSNNGSNWFNFGLSGYNTATQTVEVISSRNGQKYRCIITDSTGAQVISDAVSITIIEEQVELKILTQPNNYYGEVNDTVTFTVEAQGEGLTYQWQYKYPYLSNWHNSTIGGYNTPTQTVELTNARDGQCYRCIITDSNGETVTSEIVGMYINIENGVNLFTLPYASTKDENPVTINGVTYTENSDTTITTAGTAGGTWSMFYLISNTTDGRKTLQPGTYRLTGVPERTITSGRWNMNVYSILDTTSTLIATDEGNGIEFIITEPTSVYICSTIQGQNVDGYTWTPSLVKISDSTEHEVTVGSISDDFTIQLDNNILNAGIYTLKYEDDNNTPLESFADIGTVEV